MRVTHASHASRSTASRSTAACNDVHCSRRSLQHNTYCATLGGVCNTTHTAQPRQLLLLPPASAAPQQLLLQRVYRALHPHFRRPPLLLILSSNKSPVLLHDQLLLRVLLIHGLARQSPRELDRGDCELVVAVLVTADYSWRTDLISWVVRGSLSCTLVR